MYNDNRLSFYIKVYDDEINTKNSINGRASIVLGLIQLLIPAFIFLWIDSIVVSKKQIGIYLLTIESLQSNYIDYFVITYRFFLILLLAGIIIASYCAMRTMFFHEYVYILSPTLILNHEKTLQQSYQEYKDYYSSNGISEKQFINLEMENYLVDKLSNATDKNQESNENKLKWMNNTYKFIVGTLVIALLCLIMYLIGNCF